MSEERNAVGELSAKYGVAGEGLHQGKVIELATGDVVNKEIIRSQYGAKVLEDWLPIAKRVSATALRNQ